MTEKSGRLEPTALVLSGKEIRSLDESISIVQDLSKMYNLSFEEIVDIIDEREESTLIPVDIFRNEMGPLEALVRYLRDNKKLGFTEIAEILGRGKTTVWTTYRNSLEKKFELNKVGKTSVPIMLFSERKLSVLESLCTYLKKKYGLRYCEIADMLCRDERTIWTVVNRARIKIEAR